MPDMPAPLTTGSDILLMRMKRIVMVTIGIAIWSSSKRLTLHMTRNAKEEYTHCTSSICNISAFLTSRLNFIWWFWFLLWSNDDVDACGGDGVGGQGTGWWVCAPPGHQSSKKFWVYLPPKKVGFSMRWVCAPLAGLKKVLGGECTCHLNKLRSHETMTD